MQVPTAETGQAFSSGRSSSTAMGLSGGQRTNKRTYGSVFKNPDHELSAGRMLEACGLKGHRIGGAQISPRHANFIENADGASSADAIALMIEARRRAWEQFGVELEHEGEFLGVVELPPIPG